MPKLPVLTAEPEWVLQLPDGWDTAPFDQQSIRPMCEGPAAKAMLTQAMLTDGTNIMALMWPTGQRILRTGPATGWALQEHFDGALPDDDKARRVLGMIWRVAVESMIQGCRDADADMVRLGLPAVRPARR